MWNHERTELRYAYMSADVLIIEYLIVLLRPTLSPVPIYRWSSRLPKCPLPLPISPGPLPIFLRYLFQYIAVAFTNMSPHHHSVAATFTNFSPHSLICRATFSLPICLRLCSPKYLP